MDASRLRVIAETDCHEIWIERSLLGSKAERRIYRDHFISLLYRDGSPIVGFFVVTVKRLD